MLRFPRLFEPIKIGKVAIKNRIAMAPMNNFAYEQFSPITKSITRRCIDYYVERAKGGVGLIHTGVFKVENEIEQSTWPIVSLTGLNALAELTDYLHAHDTKLFIQLTAGAGRNMPPAEIGMGLEPVSASDNPSVWDPNVTCRGITTEEVKKIIDAFEETAGILANFVGVDGVEVHGHEGYLIDQFTMSLFNRRSDKYGGGLEERLKFPIDILNAIKNGAGKNFPVTYRMGVKHFIKDLREAGLRAGTFEEKGRDVEESREAVQLLEKAGYDGFHLDTGCYDSWYYAHPPLYHKHGFHLGLIKGFKEIVGVPIITANRLDVPELAEKAIEDGLTDIVAIGRGLLADPYWPNKVKRGNTEDVRPCIGGQIGCLENIAFHNRPFSCSVNPRCGREKLSVLEPADKPKKVLVVGGGVAGMEVSRVASLRGHDVYMYEKGNELGGHLKEASVPDFKEDLGRLLDWYKTQIKKSEVKVVFNTEVTRSVVEEVKPNVIIVATGSSLIVPKVPGVDKLKVVACCDLLLGKKEAGDTCVVVGGGLEGCETALWLAKQGKEVTIVEMLGDLMTTQTVFKANREMLVDLLKESNVRVMTNATLQEVTDEGVVIQSKAEEKTLPYDTVVLAVGLKSETSLYDLIKGETPELYKIGDCKKPRLVHEAIWEGFNIGNVI